MNTPASETAPPPDPAPRPAIPWYRSQVVRGILVAVAAQALARLNAKYHLDMAVYGVTANDVATFVLDGISAVAAGVALHGRAQPSLPDIVATKSKADAINRSIAP